MRVARASRRSNRRGANNYRDYCEEAVEHLQRLKKFQIAGFKLAEFKTLIQAHKANELSRQKIAEIFHQKMEEIDRRKAKLEQVQEFLAQMLAHKMELMDDKEKEGASKVETCI